MVLNDAMPTLHVSAPTAEGLRIILLDDVPPGVRSLVRVLRVLAPGMSTGEILAILVLRALDGPWTSTDLGRGAP